MHFSLSKGDLPPIIYALKNAKNLGKDQKIPLYFCAKK
jgi:hypothetical protein